MKNVFPLRSKILPVFFGALTIVFNFFVTGIAQVKQSPSQRKAFNGYCLVMVPAEKQPGEVQLKASSDLLKGSEIIIKIR